MHLKSYFPHTPRLLKYMRTSQRIRKSRLSDLRSPPLLCPASLLSRIGLAWCWHASRGPIYSIKILLATMLWVAHRFCTEDKYLEKLNLLVLCMFNICAFGYSLIFTVHQPWKNTDMVCKCNSQSSSIILPLDFLSPLCHFLKIKDRWELRVYLEEPVLSASGRDVSGAAAGLRRAGRGAVHWCQWEGCWELWMLGQEEEEKEEPRSGGPQKRAPQLLAISAT